MDEELEYPKDCTVDDIPKFLSGNKQGTSLIHFDHLQKEALVDVSDFSINKHK